jgi:hypothetical protein
MSHIPKEPNQRDKAMKYDQKQRSRTFLDDDSDFLARAARYYMLDMIRCEMHNEGYGLDGNTEESDVSWFARRLYERSRQGRWADGNWDSMAEEKRKEYLELAGTVLEIIPELMGRISNRCIRISEAVNSIIKAEELQEWMEKQRKTPAGKAV